MLSPNEFLRLQREQFHHDKCNHWDIICLPKPVRLKHYGLHFAKYVGRLARGSAEPKPQKQTLVDAFLISLSAANTLHQDLASIWVEAPCRTDRPTIDFLTNFYRAILIGIVLAFLAFVFPIALKSGQEFVGWIWPQRPAIVSPAQPSQPPTGSFSVIIGDSSV